MGMVDASRQDGVGALDVNDLLGKRILEVAVTALLYVQMTQHVAVERI